MKTAIYYFSATGNSLTLARNIAAGLGDTELVPISKTIPMRLIESAAERIGLVFPVYAWGMPRIVAEFAEKLSLEGKRYVFAVATCVAIPGKTLVKLREILREGGADLTAGFAVKAGNASMMKLNTLDKMMMRIDRQRKRLRTADARLEEIVQAIGNLETHRPETSSWCANAFGSFFHEKGLEHFKNTDRDFAVTGDCKGCGNCAKVCPRNNISMVEGRPSFHHDCELCHACVQWCPNFAIRHPNFDMSRPRYHHPAIRLSEMLAR